MNATEQSPQNVLIVGWDWGEEQHALWLISPTGTSAQTLPHEPEAILEWAESLPQRFPGLRVLIALEQSRGPVIAALCGCEGLELYPLNPRQLASYRDSVSPSGAKDDPGDARLLAEFLQHRRGQLRRWQPDAAETRRLGELSTLRRTLVEERKRLALQLTSSLKQYFPLILKLAGRGLCSDRNLDLLRRWPTLAELKRVHPRTLRAFLAEHGLRNADQQTEFIDAVRAAVPLTRDKALIEPRARYVQFLAAQIQHAQQAIAGFDDELRQVVAAHPDEPLFRSLPGAGDALVPRLIVAFGSDRNRYQAAEDVQCYSGIAPVTIRSGKSQRIAKRTACPKFLRQTFHEFADHARKWSRWSKAFYRMKRQAGFKHHAAVRALAFKWIRILFRLWQSRTTYSETDYIQRLRTHNSPVIHFLETAET